MGAMATGVEMLEIEQRELLLGDFNIKSVGFGPIGQGCETKFEGKFTLPPPVQGRDQLQALLRRQWLHKVHSLLTEIISFDSDLDVVEILCIFDVQFYSVPVKNPNALLLSVPTRH